MEEADALADRAGIMARRMLALGTADQLRKKHGDAYHVHLVHKNAPYTSDAEMEEIKSFIRRNFEGASTEERSFHGQLRFSVPNDRTAGRSDVDTRNKGIFQTKTTDVTSVQPANQGISALFAQLEANKQVLGFEYYSVSQATLDQVFLSIINANNVLEEGHSHEQKEGFGKKVKIAMGASSWRALLCGF